MLRGWNLGLAISSPGRIFVVFLSFSSKCWDTSLNRTRPVPFQFIIHNHPIALRYITCADEKASLNKEYSNPQNMKHVTSVIPIGEKMEVRQQVTMYLIQGF
jgi:hypothetical protein